MTFPIKAIVPTTIKQIQGVSGMVFCKFDVEPIHSEGKFLQFELPNGLYEICQDNRYLYLWVECGRGQYMTTTGAFQKAEDLEHQPDK